MATASQQVAAAYNPAVNQIQAQIPQVQALYNTLVAGLQQQGQNQAANIMQSAQARGVYQPTTAANTQAALAQALMGGQAQFGVQRAQDVAGLQGNIGQTRVQQAQVTQKQSEANQAAKLEAAKNQLALQQLQQNYSLQEAQYARQQQEAAAREAASAAKQQAAFDLTSVGEGTLARQLRVYLNGVKGKDGHVSPENLAKAYNTWQQAGLNTEGFWKNFQGLWNPKQGTYNDQFYYFVNKGV